MRATLRIRVTARAGLTGRTGAEMEALVATAAALLTDLLECSDDTLPGLAERTQLNAAWLLFEHVEGRDLPLSVDRAHLEVRTVPVAALVHVSPVTDRTGHGPRAIRCEPNLVIRRPGLTVDQFHVRHLHAGATLAG